MPKRGHMRPLETVPVDVADRVHAAQRAVLAVDVHAGNLLRAANEANVDARIYVLIQAVAHASRDALVAANLASQGLR